ncbi:glycosyltransferase [Poritiphilus flavus]|uniref:Glycosyltransferase n=1 Tax=Poritiphilus flavus TaxID=2697053 RepID=A0A6L9E8D2_9FLAO|nr:glycosyltransferase [Poritiphilus flavus]NAS10852.1 glycosyltransferase [Poritiphilus flavus]
MKILLASIGTRGDMEPFLAVGELLQKRGHEVVCLFPEHFRSLAEASGFRFGSLGPEFIDLLESDIGKAAMGGSASVWQKIKAYSKMARIFAPIRKELVKRQKDFIETEKPDRIVHHAKALYPFFWGQENPGKNILVLPVPYVMHPVKDQAHVMFNRDLGPFLNRATYGLARFGLLKATKSDAKGLVPESMLANTMVKKMLDETPSIYTISPSLFSRPSYWPSHVQVLGYHERNKILNWEPDEALQAFMQKHPKFVLVTFGSMINPAPQRKTATIVRALEKYQIPALINCAEGGLEPLSDFNRELIHFVHGIPYDYIFPRTYAVVHHGGSGTSHMAMKYACASMIIPHIIDQFLWNKILSEKGVGPKGPSITSLNSKNFDPKLSDLWQNNAYKAKAKELAGQMALEKYENELAEAIVNQTD